MVINAIEILREAMRAAWDAPIEPTRAVDLALDTLIREEVAEDHQAGRYVDAMTSHRDVVGTVDGYMRQTNMEQMLMTWESEVRRRDRRGLRHGEPFPPDPFAR